METRPATEEELRNMSFIQKDWYENNTVPLFLMPDGRIQGQGLEGMFGGCRYAVAQIKKADDG